MGPVLATLIVIAATVAAGYFIYTRVRPAPTTVAQQTAKVTRGSIAATVNATGTIASSALSRVNFRGSGTIAEVLVQVGDRVEVDQPLARLDSTDLRFAVQQAQARLDVAQIKLRQMVDGPRVEDVAAAQAALAAAQVKLDGMQYSRPEDVEAAQAAVEAAMLSLQKLVKPEGADVVAAENALQSAKAQLASDLARLDDAQTQIPTDRASAEAAVVAAQSELATAQQRLDTLIHPQPADVASAQTAIRTAQVAVDNAQSRLTILLNPTAQDVSAARAALDSARGALQTAQRNLASVRIGPSSADVASAQAALATAQSALHAAIAKRDADYQAARLPVPTTSAESTAERATGLPAATVAQLLADDHAVDAAEVNVSAAQAKLTQLQRSPTGEELAVATAQVDAAQAAFSTAQSKLDSLVSPRAEDVSTAQGDVEGARATLASAQTKLDQLLSPSQGDVAVAEQAVSAAQSNLLSAQQRSAQATGSAADASLAAASSAVESSTNAVRTAQARLDQLRTPLDSDVQAAQQALQQAQAKLATTTNPSTSFDLAAQRQAIAQTQANLELKRTPYLASDIESQRAAVRQTQTDLDTAQFNLDNSTLTAPFSGSVSAVNMNPGETAAGAAATITGGTTQSGITLVNPARLRADVQVGETDVSRIAIGQPARVTFDAFPNRQFPGQVSAIAPSGTTSQGVVSYLVSITMADPTDVRPGMTATAEITTAERDDVLMVPNRAIVRQGQTRTVRVAAASTTETRTVQIGTANDQYTEIVSGLQEGDEVVLPTTTARAAVPGAGMGGGGGPPPGGF